MCGLVQYIVFDYEARGLGKLNTAINQLYKILEANKSNA